MADYLPQDVLVNIFTRLPIKTVLQCTSVCKLWHSLIVNPSFIDSHLNRPPTQAYNNAHHLLLVRTCFDDDEGRKELYSLHCDNEAFDEYAKLQFPFNMAYNRFYRIVGSCNGILCLTDDQMTYVDNTILWNPTIQKWVRLPKPRVTFTSHGGFDHAIGFGFDAKSNDYKVVRIVRLLDFESEVPPEIDLYSLNTGAWRNISHLGLPCVISGRATQAYLNGAAHWIGADMERHCIMFLSFHMGDEAFRSMSLPADVPFLPWGLIPAVIQGSLSVIEEKGFSYERSWCIWVMKEYGVASSWTKLIDVGIGEQFDMLIGFRKEGELLIKARGDLISFSPRDAQVKGLGIRSNTRGWYDESLHTDAYVESLVLLGSPEETKEDEVACEEEKEVEVGCREEEIESTEAAETRHL
ncbi:hypothetical protein RHGRI_017404 [Rhododendron griersonianum]|uniref:F-box domain-containing protein n=1 Tax=Rhododendron griersonianum TaxID=479676 RepID=A0AAV6JXM8_9ERIC|nr:hypothetical protein RHGRI_017404 [Rhododendron griersonianum]